MMNEISLMVDTYPIPLTYIRNVSLTDFENIEHVNSFFKHILIHADQKMR